MRYMLLVVVLLGFACHSETETTPVENVAIQAHTDGVATYVTVAYAGNDGLAGGLYAEVPGPASFLVVAIPRTGTKQYVFPAVYDEVHLIANGRTYTESVLAPLSN